MSQAWRVFGELVPLLAVVGVISAIATWRTVRRSRIAGNTAGPVVVDSLARIWAVAAVVGVAIITLEPIGGPGTATGINLVPLRSLIDLATRSVDASVAIRNVAGNVLLFVPVGIALGVGLRARPRPLVSAVRVGLLVSLAIEVAQFVFAVGRVVDVDDVLLNVLGTTLGAALVVLLIRAGRALNRSAVRGQAGAAPSYTSRGVSGNAK